MMNLWPMIQPMLAGQLRHLLTVAAGYLIAHGAIMSSDESSFISMGVGLIMWAATAAWSAYQKNTQNDVISVMARMPAVVQPYVSKADAIKVAKQIAETG